MIHVLGQIKPGALVGGKARQLDALIKGGFSVPAGVVLDAQCWEGEAWQEELLSVLKSLQAKRYAVRSSAEAEDGKDTSFAGVFRSAIAVPVEEVVDAVTHIRTHASNIIANTSFAVIIQAWVEGSVSGVSFSRHPTRDYGTCHVTDALPGRATQIVDGTHVPLRAFCWSTTELIPETFPLNQSDLQQLNESVRKIEHYFGFPVDIEWTYDHAFYILQARPMTRLPAPDCIDHAESVYMQRYAHTKDLHLIKNELEETLPFPSRASFDLLRLLFRDQGSYHHACRELGIPYNASHVDRYFVMLLGQLSLDPSHAPLAPPKGFLQTIRASWRLQRHLREFPYQFYQAPRTDPPDHRSLPDLLSEFEKTVGRLYAQASILARFGMNQPHVAGLSIEQIWERRTRWSESRPKYLPTLDLELSASFEERIRTEWKKPRNTKDLYAILREDAKDEIRPWLVAIKHISAHDQPLIAPPSELTLPSPEEWQALRAQAPHHHIAHPFTWHDLWDIRVSATKNSERDSRSIGVSSGIAEGIVMHGQEAQTQEVTGKILILEACTPEWIPLLKQHPRGIITEKGGLMSHGAIQCREQSIPAIFGVQHARSRFPINARVQMDGKRGEITLLT